jgi:hypothetical protein
MKTKPKPRARRRPGCKGRANRKRDLSGVRSAIENDRSSEPDLIDGRRSRMMRQNGNGILLRQRNILVASFLLLLVATIGIAVDSRDEDAMQSEREARWPKYLGESLTEDQVIVKSLRASEDRLYVNEEPFVLTHKTSIVDEKGRRLRPGSIWVGWLVELRYRTGQKSEARAYGPDEKVLVRMRVLKRLLSKEDLLE